MAYLHTLRTLLQQINASSPMLMAVKQLTSGQRVRPPSFDPTDLSSIVMPADSVNLPLPLRLAYLMAHRVGDLLRLRCCNVVDVSTHVVSSLALVIIRGKTVASTGPYAIQLPPSGWAATQIRALVSAQLALRRPYVFLDAPNILQDAEETQAVLALEKTLSRETRIDLRAPRRGALTFLAAAGVEMADTRLLSRHTSDQTTRIYLAAGVFDTAAALKMHKMISLLEQCTDMTFSATPISQ